MVFIEFLGKAYFSLLGGVYLYANLRSRRKVKEVLIRDYESSFITAGRILSLQFMTVVIILLIVGLLFATVYAVMVRH